MAKVVDSYKKYYSNNTIEFESIYANGKIIKTTNYFFNGKISSELVFNDKEELDSYSYYNPKGKNILKKNIKVAELKYGLQYSYNNPKPVEVNLTKKHLLYLVWIIKNKSLAFLKKKKTGEWNYYFTNGNLKIKENFVDGKQSGISYTYNIEENYPLFLTTQMTI